MSRKIADFIVPGKPMGKQRPRVTHTGHAFTPKETMAYENYVRMCFLNSEHPEDPTDKAVRMTVIATFPIPTSWSKKKQREAEESTIPYTHKSDIDNCLKIVMDSLNGLAYKDDAQITTICGTKIYGKSPSMVVCIEEIEEGI